MQSSVGRSQASRVRKVNAVNWGVEDVRQNLRTNQTAGSSDSQQHYEDSIFIDGQTLRPAESPCWMKLLQLPELWFLELKGS